MTHKAPPSGQPGTVGVVGAGTMGAGIAQVAATAGHEVRLFDTDADRAAAGAQGIADAITRLIAKGRVDEAAGTEAIARVQTVGALTDLAGCDLVIEAIVESLPVKRAVFAELERTLAADAILATNTSSLSVTDIAAELERPGRVVGMHFFNPAPVLPLVEVVAGAATEPAVLDTGYDLAAAWGKVPVRTASTPGFIVNRVARPYYLEPFAAYAAGLADPATIDLLLRGAGFRMGPFELTDLIGHDVNTAVSRSVWSALGEDARFTPSAAQEALVAAGRLGRKSEHGWYDYPPGPPAPADALQPADDDTATDVLEALHGNGFRLTDGLLLETDGRTAAAREALLGAPVVLVDLLAGAPSTAVALTRSPAASAELAAEASEVFARVGVRTYEVADLPGLVVARTLAMLVNLAVDAVEQGVATAADVDLAMVKGVNYPHGPLVWGDAIGADRVVAILDHLAASDLELAAHRYAAAPLLRTHAADGTPLR